MKRLVAILLLLAAALACAGCHKATPLESFEIPEEFDTAQTYEITFWAKNENNATQRALYEQIVADFEALYPNIHVTIQHYTSYQDIYDAVLTNTLTGTTPNVCVTYPDHIATYLTGENTVVPLDALFSDEKYGLGGSDLRFDGPTQAEIIPQFLEECVVNGNYYALPFMRSTEACYVNKTYVEKLGFTLPETLTWDFIWEVCAAAMEKNADGTFAVNGQKTMIPFIYKSTDNMMIQLLKQTHAGYSTDAGQVEIFNDTTEALLRELYDHAKTREFTTFSISGYPANYLNAGQCIFAVDSTAGATWMGSSAPLMDVPEDRLVEFETAVMSVPQTDPEEPVMISQGPSLCIFNKEDPQEVLASWLFSQYLLSNGPQIAYSQTEGYLPVTSKAHSDPTYQDYLSRAGQDNDFYYDVKIRSARLLLENTENTFVTPVFNGSTDLRQAAGQMIEEAVKAGRRNIAMDDAFLETLYADMTSLYKLDQIQTADRQGVNYGNKIRMDPLPTQSVVLLAVLGLAWVGILLYAVIDRIKKKKSANKY